MATKKYDVVAVTGTYKDRDGNEKKRYLNVGVVFESDKGLSMKLECVPVGEWNGWLSLYEPTPRNSSSRESAVHTRDGDDFGDF